MCVNSGAGSYRTVVANVLLFLMVIVQQISPSGVYMNGVHRRKKKKKKEGKKGDRETDRKE